jgi:NHLM bacteriocin system ABC transporter peptidase/ATP-binding protein
MKKNDEKKEKEYDIVNTPTVFQMEAVECGAASLTMIMGYYKKFLPLSDVREACGVSRDGSKASNIVKAAEKYGLDSDGYRVEAEELKNMKPPMIIHWNFNHFVVFEGIKGNYAHLNDPAEGKRKVSLEEFKQSFTGIVLTFSPNKNFVPEGKQKTVLGSIKERLVGIRLAIFFVFLAGLGMIIPGLLIPTLSRLFVDRVLISKSTSLVTPLLLGLLFMGFLKSLLFNLQNIYLRKLQTKISVSTTSKFLWHLLKMPMNFFYQRFAADINNRVDSNSYMAEILSSEFASAGIDIFYIIFYFFLMIQYSVILTVVGTVISLANLVLLRYISGLTRMNNMRMLQESGKLSSISYTGINLIESIKAGGGEYSFFNKWAGHHAKLLDVEQSLGLNSVYISAIPMFFSSLCSIAILSLGSFEVLKGNLSIGALVGFQSLMQSFTSPINGLISFFTGLQKMKGTLDRLDDVLESKPDPMISINHIEPDRVNANSKVKLEGYIKLDKISFGYSPLEPPLIENFSLELKPGSRVALVGMSGSGKSTITKVVSGLYKEWSGDIYFDGINRKDIPKDIINNSLSVIDQEIVSFDGTIRDNIKLWDNSITDEAMVQACKDAYIHEDIISRKEGYDFYLKQGMSGFSGGQLQRLEIARVLAANPSIIIMDEATSALDSSTEKLIDLSIRKRGCTTIIVAHRLSTIRDSDKIIVLNRGKVEQEGTHEELKKVEGLYATLINSI